MPYLDEKGTILIDEIEAANDVDKLNAARDQLKSAMNKIQQIMMLNADFSGPVKDSVEEATANFTSALKSQIEMIESTVSYINHVVEHYEAIDRNLKGTINTYLP